MKRLIRKFLGLDDIEARLSDIQYRLANDLHDDLLGIRSDLSVTFGDEHSPQRKAMSDRLGQRVIARLEAEDKARKHTLGEA